MIQRIQFILLTLLLALLPWHGFLTTILPGEFRFWKEGVLGLLLILNLTNIKEQISKSKFSSSQVLKFSSFWILLFLIYGALLVLTAQDQSTALIAFRYISTGYIAYLIFSLIPKSLNTQYLIRNTFLISCLLSVLFGLWAKYLGGYEVLSGLYSKTISSWVPGQTLPIYHEANGVIRMQGGTSGPVAFGHMMLAGLFLMLFNSNSKEQISNIKSQTTVYCLLSIGLLLTGIYQSYSRAALAMAIILIVVKIWTMIKWQWNQKTSFSFISLVVLCGLLLFTPQVQFHMKFLLNRAGTSQHFTRPVQALKDGLASPLIGNLGSYGPAARAKNLRENNNDQAPIAENVLADTFVQTGLIGLILILGFWITLWRGASFNTRIWIITILLTTSLATLFDMIPLAIIYMWVLTQSKRTIVERNS